VRLCRQRRFFDMRKAFLLLHCLKSNDGQLMPAIDFHSTLLAVTLLLSTVLDAIEYVVRLPITVFHAYSDLVRWAADTVHELFDRYGYWVIFLGTMCENTLLVGLIVPGALVVILAGLAAQDGSISLPVAIGVGIAGTVIGDTISYCLGRFGWARFGQGAAFNEALAKVREPILRRGVLFVLVYHFAGYTRLVGPTAAGLLKLPFARWAPFDYIGASLWITTFTCGGYILGLLGLSLDSSSDWFRFIEWGLLVAVGIWGFYLVKMAMPYWEASQQAAAVKEEAEAAALAESET
jgi:membrane-associated protein